MFSFVRDIIFVKFCNHSCHCFNEYFILIHYLFIETLLVKCIINYLVIYSHQMHNYFNIDLFHLLLEGIEPL